MSNFGRVPDEEYKNKPRIVGFEIKKRERQIIEPKVMTVMIFFDVLKKFCMPHIQIPKTTNAVVSNLFAIITVKERKKFVKSTITIDDGRFFSCLNTFKVIRIGITAKVAIGAG